jgi:chromosome partitioning protein
MPENAVVIAVASSKGGCGKSTAAVILAGEYASQGYRVHLIDADPKKRIIRWAEAGAKPEAVTASVGTATTMREEIDKARASADVVVIDVEGSANAALTLAVAFANIVIIPAKVSPPDVEDGIGTLKLVRDLAAASRRDIPHGFLWSEYPPAIRSREMMNLEGQVAKAGIPVIGRIFQRSAFSALFSFATTLDHLPSNEVAGIDKAKGDAVRLTDAIDALLSPQSAPSVAPSNHEAAA